MVAKNLKKIVMVFILLILSVVSYAQKDVTQFLGIPVDGSKSEMIKKLKAKGFTSDSFNKDVLVGEFNGTNVNIYIATTNNKVSRIMVCDANTISEVDIKIRFNNLCHQFQNNGRYIPAMLSNYEISENEDISYEMTVNKKRYDAVYYQLPADLDTLAFAEEIQSVLLSKYTEEQLSNPIEELQTEMMISGLSYMLDKYSKKTVWFKIDEYYGEYYVTMFYDNEYNRANGEDL
ncbi:MAG: hypothetical protein FWF52_01450 [Candidatus Azobacteroides sp.]|nr:hypothetical protein [Candidatus Azobacteroides sp.]